MSALTKLIKNLSAKVSAEKINETASAMTGEAVFVMIVHENKADSKF